MLPPVIPNVREGSPTYRPVAPWSKVLLCSLVALTALLLGAGCGSQGEEAGPETHPAPAVTETADTTSVPAFGNVSGTTAYVGDAACFDCHEDLYRGYQSHGMARSYYPLTPDNAVEDFHAEPVYHAASDLYYRAFAREGRFYQEEYRLDASGRRVHHLERRMDDVMGSGNAARTYLSRSNGRLYELPLTWYTQVGHWDLSPGYAVANKRFDRLVPDRCMACHNSYPESVPYVEGKYTSVPEGIGCERCHGPGALHVEARLSTPEVPGGVDATIVNPAHLPLDRQLDVCQQCHLHTTVSVLREGRTPFDFRPSQRLADYVSLFSADEPVDTDDITVISHADRMKQSACFTGTAGTEEAMTCVTCHNPHEGFRASGPSYFNETCEGCHEASVVQGRVAEAVRGDHVPGSGCTGCHMPRVEAGEAPHASFTDHWIRVVEEQDAVALPHPAASHGPLRLEPYFARDREGTEARVYEGLAYLVAGTQRSDTLALGRGIALLEEILATSPGYSEAQFQVGLAHYRLGRAEAAVPYLEAAVRLSPDVPERLNALALAYEAAGRNPVTIGRIYRRALALQPALADVRVNYGRFLEQQGRLDDAQAAYREAADEQPWLAEAHFNLGTLYLRRGDLGAAETSLQRAVDLDPDYAKAFGNLGLLYAGRGETERARDAFERAVAAAPGDATALGNLGAFYLNAGDLERAVDLLQRAVTADPANVDGFVNLALAYFNDNALAEARRAAEQALRLDPSNATARQILGAL